MKTITIAGGLLASTMLLTGCGMAGLVGPRNEDTVTYDVKDKVGALRLESGAGDSVITETGGNVVRVTEILRWSGDDKPKPRHSVDGDELSVSYQCPAAWSNCSVDYKIEIPKGLAVHIQSGSGDVTLRSLTGSLDVRAGSGDVDASGLAGKTLSVQVGSGNIALKSTIAPDRTELDTGSGDIELTVPDGAYAVTSRIGSGDLAVHVRKDAASPHKISIRAGSGNVTVAAG